LAVFGALACGGPLAALPLANAATQGPETLAAPMEDGSTYVLASGGPLSSQATLRTLWRRQAAKACHGEYMVLSEHDGQSQRGGVVSGRSYEGFVRCVSGEGMGLDPDLASSRTTHRRRPPISVGLRRAR
jgi:hypothetical protein